MMTGNRRKLRNRRSEYDDVRSSNEYLVEICVVTLPRGLSTLSLTIGIRGREFYLDGLCTITEGLA
jgi:hypothetical protein